MKALTLVSISVNDMDSQKFTERETLRNIKIKK